MDRAIDPTLGFDIQASLAVGRRRYRCVRCGKPAVLRDGGQRAAHFAHLTGADPKCELYTKGKPGYSGRRVVVAPRKVASDWIGTDYIGLAITPDGPELVLQLPPTANNTWDGVIEFSAYRVTRIVRCEHLTKGLRISFPLFDGTWDVRPEGDIPIEYSDRIQVGRQSLEGSFTLFNGSQPVGRRILPGESIACGDTIRRIGRQPFVVPEGAESLISSAPEFECNGWFGSLIAICNEIKDIADRELLERILERSIHDRGARVWIESPWPEGHSNIGVPRFLANAKGFEFRADKPADLAVVNALTREVAAQADQVAELNCANLAAGLWELRVNDYLFDIFEVVEEQPKVPVNVLLRIDEAPPRELSALVEIELCSESVRKSGSSVRIAWGANGIREQIRISGAEISEETSTSICLLPLDNADVEVDCDNLGQLILKVVTKQDVQEEWSAELNARAQWLLSMAQPADFGPERIAIPPRFDTHPLAHRLKVSSWQVELAPQVRTLNRLLGKSA